MGNEDVLGSVGVLALSTAAGLVAGWLSGVAVRWAGRHRNRRFLARLHRSCHRPWSAVLVVTALYFGLYRTSSIGEPRRVLHHALLLTLIATSAWLLVKVLFVAEETALQWLRVDVADNRRARRARTQIGVLRRLTAGIVSVCAFAAMLMTFAPLRTLGASLLASAGVLGAVAGLAAQATLSNVFAGLQLAMTDALRFDDVVVVDGEWGRVEELTLTNVVVRLWDERRLVLPATHFTNTPFQNWTRNEARVLGAVVLHLDYSAPVAELRAEARRIVERSPLWDRREWVLQVVDSTPSTMVVRVLASSADAPSSWDLRCELREQLIEYLQTHHPNALPRAYLLPPELDQAPGAPLSAARPGTAEPNNRRARR